MRLALLLPLAVAVLASDIPDPEYKAELEQELVPSVMEMEPGEGYIINLACEGCPSAYGERKPIVGDFNKGTSLLLNISLAADARSILLNSRPIAPLAPLPLDISAPVSLKYLPMVTLSVLDAYEVLQWSSDIDKSLYYSGTEALHLQYEHAVVGTQERDSWWVTFDVLGVNSYHVQRPKGPLRHLEPMPSQQEQDDEEELREKQWQEFQQKKPKINHALTAEEQQLVQFRVKQDPVSRTLRIEEVQLVRRADRVKPAIMKCGRPAIMTTSFNPLEWDAYGQIGSLTHGWNVFWQRTFSFLMGPGLVLIVLTTVVGLGAVVKRHIQERKERALERCADEEDAGVALLAGEGEVEAEDELEKEGDEEKA